MFRQYRTRILGLAVAVVTLGVALIAVQRTNGAWPLILAARTQQTFVDPGKDDGDTPFRLIINDSRNAAAYRLECHNGNYEGPGDITFSGDFHCALFAIANDTRQSANLLAEDNPAQRGSDWLNRGRMRAAQLRGQCAETPYGLTRVFRMRGMRVTFQFSNLKWLDDQLKQFTFDVSVSPDSGAESARSEPVSAPKAIEASCL